MARQAKIVVAGDSPVYRELVRQALVEKGYGVKVAANGRQAVELVSDFRPGVLVTDWEMPDLSGLELSNIVRQNPSSFVYIVLLTANSNMRFLDKCGIPHKTLKSRRLAGRHVLNALTGMSVEELDRLARFSGEEGANDYANLAREIMGRRT